MSLSKLDPAPTSGSSSQISFDGQNPFPEKQHPLLLPTVLDNIFQYMTFAELKSCRLVCKPWSEVGIPFIGQKLEPVNFSKISYEDFLALKQEFQEFQDQSKPHPKLKLFQGFRQNWEQVGTMSYCNFLPSFQPSQLVISGKDVNDPSVSLRSLLQPIVATLRDLTLKIKWHRITAGYFTFDLLQNLAESGMTLRRLHLDIFEDNRTLEQDYDQRNVPFNREGTNSILRQILSRLLESQAPFLEDLSLKFNCNIESEGGIHHKIKLAPFPRLKTLALDLKLMSGKEDNASRADFQSFDFCVKFPNLLHLKLFNQIFWEMYGWDGGEMVEGSTTFDLTRGHPLKKLNIISSKDYDFPNERLNELWVSFPYLEEFSAHDIIPTWVKIPWVNTIKNLELRGISRGFNYLSLKELEYLHYTICNDAGYVSVNGLIKHLSAHYTQLPHLKKIHLSGLKILREQRILIQERLPAEIRAILTID